MKERKYLISNEGKFFKANLHSHTTVSDGALSPEESKKLYKDAGYSIVAYTDHRKYVNHIELNDDNFLAIAGYEIDINESGKNWENTKVYHLNLYDTNPNENTEEKQKSYLPPQDYYDIKSINKYLKEMKELGFIICYNHPFWSLQDYTDIKDLDSENIWAMEIYNYGCELDGLYGYNPQTYDEMLRLNKKWFCVATDDNHNSFPTESSLCDSFGGFTMIKANELSYSAIIDSLINGNFYSSMGPEIKELYIEENKLHIKTSPVEKIFVILKGRNCYKKLANKGETITEAVFELNGKEEYFRIDIKDEKGLHANSNAYFIKDILK